MTIRMLRSAAGAALCAILLACGGGGSAALDPVAATPLAVPAPPTPAVLIPAASLPYVSVAPGAPYALAFEEPWDQRGVLTGVFGAYAADHLGTTPDGSDTQQDWLWKFGYGRWGTLVGLDGSSPGMPNVRGTGPNEWWHVDAGRLVFAAHPVTVASGFNTGGWPLISMQTFPRGKRIVAETDIRIDGAGDTGMAGLALIAGEGDYRELGLYRRGAVDTIDLVRPLSAQTLAPRTTDVVTLRIEYDPVSGFRYLANGVLIGTEAIDHLGASFASDPSVALYFVGNASVPAAFVQGSVGPVRVWVD